jgi:hypothetical protein
LAFAVSAIEVDVKQRLALLDSAEFRSATNVAARIRAAQEIVDALQRCRMEPAFCQSRENVRMYARDVLRLAVDA